VNPFEFLDELSIAKTRVLGLSVGENSVILACIVLTQCRCVMDRETGGQPDHTNTGLCIASYADAIDKSIVYFTTTVSHVRQILQ